MLIRYVHVSVRLVIVPAACCAALPSDDAANNGDGVLMKRLLVLVLVLVRYHFKREYWDCTGECHTDKGNSAPGLEDKVGGLYCITSYVEIFYNPSLAAWPSMRVLRLAAWPSMRVLRPVSLVSFFWFLFVCLFSPVPNVACSNGRFCLSMCVSLSLFFCACDCVFWRAHFTGTHCWTRCQTRAQWPANFRG